MIRSILEASPLLALFIAVAAGYAIGQISIAGVSFGAGAVLFSGLFIGAIAPRPRRPAWSGPSASCSSCRRDPGPQFFASLRGPGVKYILLAAVAVIASLGVSLLVAGPLGISLATGPGCSPGRGRARGCSRPCGGGEPGSRDRLFGVLPVRRHGPIS